MHTRRHDAAAHLLGVATQTRDKGPTPWKQGILPAFDLLLVVRASRSGASHPGAFAWHADCNSLSP